MLAGLRFDLKPDFLVGRASSGFPDHLRDLPAAGLDRLRTRVSIKALRELIRGALGIVKLPPELVHRAFHRVAQLGIVAKLRQPLAQVRGELRADRLHADPIERGIDARDRVREQRLRNVSRRSRSPAPRNTSRRIAEQAIERRPARELRSGRASCERGAEPSDQIHPV